MIPNRLAPRTPKAAELEKIREFPRSESIEAVFAFPLAALDTLRCASLCEQDFNNDHGLYIPKIPSEDFKSTLSSIMRITEKFT
ncbi:hypothetical protein AVEN_267705-1 [Araneus ventricosus]|uniref:Uncharacterized protein n=1 Tax=Araneus ventricosus TaxID=182803 RepID=A0A4Y2CVG1_ARAVE|nr:hypothetical protein AVEN_267705-1 [Araneus ventricosus]